eukprot:scaffold26125_cov103-Isochrysis_galbana.AAC.5
MRAHPHPHMSRLLSTVVARDFRYSPSSPPSLPASHTSARARGFPGPEPSAKRCPAHYLPAPLSSKYRLLQGQNGAWRRLAGASTGITCGSAN